MGKFMGKEIKNYRDRVVCIKKIQCCEQALLQLLQPAGLQ
jgi:hypothetical protein